MTAAATANVPDCHQSLPVGDGKSVDCQDSHQKEEKKLHDETMLMAEKDEMERMLLLLCSNSFFS